MDRREFLKVGAMTAALAAVASKLPAQIVAPATAAEPTPPKDGAPDVAVVRNGEPVAMFRKGIEALGGMAAFVKPGQSVCVKPNIGWDRAPEYAADTNPDLVGEIVKQCLAVGASKVEVFDHTCHNWVNSYKNSGIRDAVEAAGGVMLPGNEQSWYVDREEPRAVVMKNAKIHKTLLESDIVINVPICKNHGGARLTAILKNWMGVVWDRRWMHQNNMPQSIADSYLYRPADLNILDAYRILLRGPQGGNLDDVQNPKYIVISKDPVVVDAMGARIMGYELKDVPYIAMAERLGLGVADQEKHVVARLEA